METVDILASTLAGLVQIAPKQDGRKYLCGVRFDTAGYAVATDDFLAAYRGRLRAAYPRHPDGYTLFPFQRIFLVARC